MKWIKHIWNKIFHPKRDSLRERFNRIRASRAHPTFDHVDLYNAKMKGTGFRKIRTCGCGYPLSGSSDAEVDAFMEKTMNNLKKVPYVDVSGSYEGYNTRFALQNMTESVWIPVRDTELSASL